VAADEAAPPPQAGFDAAADRIRETAKWLIASFAAVGAVLVAGTQLSNLGSLPVGEARFWIAVAGVVVALTAVVVAIAVVSGVLVVEPSNMKDLAEKPDDATQKLRDVLEADRSIVSTGSLATLSTSFVDALERRDSAYAAWRRAPDDEDLGRKAQIAQDYAALESAQVQQVLAVANLLRVSNAFKGAKFWLLGTTIAAAAGITAFAAAANPPRTVDPVGVTTGNTVTVELTALGRSVLRARAGDTCAPATVRAIALAVSGAGVEVVTLPRRSCPAHRFTVQKGLGTVR
jgi:hypothetical protein